MSQESENAQPVSSECRAALGAQGQAELCELQSQHSGQLRQEDLEFESGKHWGCEGSEYKP